MYDNEQNADYRSPMRELLIARKPDAIHLRLGMIYPDKLDYVSKSTC